MQNRKNLQPSETFTAVSAICLVVSGNGKSPPTVPRLDYRTAITGISLTTARMPELCSTPYLALCRRLADRALWFQTRLRFEDYTRLWQWGEKSLVYIRPANS